MVKAITTKEEFDTLVSVLYLSEESALTRCQINSGDVVVVDFWATWCGPCKLISPHFTKLEEKFPAVKFAKVDVEEVEDVAKDQEIRAMPTFKAYKNGKPIDQITGAVPAKLTVSGPVVLSRRKTHADDNVRLFNNRSCPLYPPYSPDSLRQGRSSVMASRNGSRRKPRRMRSSTAWTWVGLVSHRDQEADIAG
jgi:thioredoxin 1